jgi:gamma-glutamyl phosphate reductase
MAASGYRRSRASAFRIWQHRRRVSKSGNDALRTVTSMAMTPVCGQRGQCLRRSCSHADMDAAVDAAVFGAFFNAGECCNAGSRLILERSIAEPFLTEITKYANRLKVGNPLDPATKVGALISAEHLRSVEQRVRGGRGGCHAA